MFQGTELEFLSIISFNFTDLTARSLRQPYPFLNKLILVKCIKSHFNMISIQNTKFRLLFRVFKGITLFQPLPFLKLVKRSKIHSYMICSEYLISTSCYYLFFSSGILPLKHSFNHIPFLN